MCRRMFCRVSTTMVCIAPSLYQLLGAYADRLLGLRLCDIEDGSVLDHVPRPRLTYA